MSNAAITTKGPGDLWHEPTPEPGFHDWWETVSEADKKEWIADFVINKSGPLAPFHHWMEVLTNEGAYIDIDAIYVHDDWLARDRHGNYLTYQKGIRTLYRVEMYDLCAFMAAAEYGRRHAGEYDYPAAEKLRNLMSEVIHTYLMDWMEDEENMKQVWEAL
tara:strand:+ start:639 stop:1121 length:483 start_codon:yes stop_codon:yes gene_type:complete